MVDQRHKGPKGYFSPQLSDEERRRLKSLSYFGFEFRDKPTEDDPRPEDKISFVPPQHENDPAFTVSAAVGGILQHTVDLRGDTFADERELIAKYRSAAEQPEVDQAIQDIVDEAIVHNDEDLPVSLNLDNVDVDGKTKELIVMAFEKVCELLEFRKYGADIFRRWYVDGKIAYHKVIDLKNPSRGLQELRPLSPMKIQKIREIEEKVDPRTGATFVIGTSEYFIYSAEGFTSTPSNTAYNGANSAPAGNRMILRLPKDTVSYVTSGLVSADKSIPLSHLHKALRKINQLRMMEDSLVIYRLARAPERRVFSIDVGDMTAGPAEAYIARVMERYKSKIVYDATTGSVKSDARHMHMLEDFYLPKTASGRGTEVTSLAGGANLGEIDDIIFFQKALYKALNVPANRLEEDTPFSFGRTSEITRDELRFQKFINRLRVRFAELFKDLLRTQLILKKIITEDEWQPIAETIMVDYAKDSHFTELKETELIKDRLDLLASVEAYVGTYFSKEYVRKKILRQNDEEIKEIKNQIRHESLTRDSLPDAEAEGAMGGEGGGGGGAGGIPGPDVGIEPEGEDLGDFEGVEGEGDFALGDPEGAATDLGAEGEEETEFEDDDFADDDFPQLDDEEEQQI